jgi:hypothetical protein
MLVDKKTNYETLASRILSRQRDYGMSNPKGQVFDRQFNRIDTDREIEVSRNIVGQGRKQLSYPNGLTPDGYSSFAPTMGVNVSNLDPQRAYEATAENQVIQYWKKNRERVLKYYRVSGRAEVSESLDAICDEGVYPNDLGEICSLRIDPDAQIGESVRANMHRTFRREVLNRIMDFTKDGWFLMRTLLIEGRLFLEVVYSEDEGEIVGVNLLPSQNMIVITQDGVIVGYRQMLEGTYTAASNTAGKNYIDYSPNQILYSDLNMFGPGGINDIRSPIEPAIKPFNQLNSIEDSVTMYRIQWGSEKLVFKIDTGMMPKPKAEKHMKDQAKLLSRRVDYNTGTGEVTNVGRVIGLGEHFFISTSNQSQGSEITRLEGGDNIGNIEDVKYFKRNLVNAMKVPPGRITALAGDGENYSNGKIGEVTQSEVSFARMVQRYQIPLQTILTRIFVMVLNTKNEIAENVKMEENFGVIFEKTNSFQNYINSEILNLNLDTFDKVMKWVKTPENQAGVLSKRWALVKGLKMTDEDIVLNSEFLAEEEKQAEEGGGNPTDAGL